MLVFAVAFALWSVVAWCLMGMVLLNPSVD